MSDWYNLSFTGILIDLAFQIFLSLANIVLALPNRIDFFDVSSSVGNGTT